MFLRPSFEVVHPGKLESAGRLDRQRRSERRIELQGFDAPETACEKLARRPPLFLFRVLARPARAGGQDGGQPQFLLESPHSVGKHRPGRGQHLDPLEKQARIGPARRLLQGPAP